MAGSTAGPVAPSPPAGSSSGQNRYHPNSTSVAVKYKVPFLGSVQFVRSAKDRPTTGVHFATGKDAPFGLVSSSN